jgi:hypothetical protein
MFYWDVESNNLKNKSDILLTINDYDYYIDQTF